MRLRSIKIPLRFLITGFIWALFSTPIISLIPDIPHETRDIIRGINNFSFVGIAAVILYFEIKKQQKKLVASEDQYRQLFEMNPGPMWIFNSETLHIVKVNNAAIDLYGYTENEFLSMSILDIRPGDERERLIDCMNISGPGLNKKGVWKHLKKNGETLYVSVVNYELLFNGVRCRLTIATNITDIILKEEKIKVQNAALHEIAWLNSHEVRRALCSVMSLTGLVKDACNESERKEYLQLLQQCTNDLDEVLKKTNNKVDELKIDQFVF